MISERPLSARKKGGSMLRRIEYGRMAAGSVAIALFALAGILAPVALRAQSGHKLLGGPRGVVRSNKGVSLEGIMVQLLSQKSSIRTTVYSNDDGRNEFPKLEAGSYVLRIARPLEYHPFVREGVQISGPSQLEDIVLERVTEAELLPPFPAIAAQLTGAEWLASLPGSGGVKRRLVVICNWCHSYQQIFRNRYDQESWSRIVFR